MSLPRALPRLLLLAALLLTPASHRAESHVCAVLAPADLKALLGGAVVAAPNGGACKWSAAGSDRKLLAVRVKAKGPGAEMAYAGARQNAGQDGASKVTDLTGVGDKAFAVQASFGVALFTMKGGRLLQLQYWTNAMGTPKDVEALKPVASKAAAAF